MLLCGLVFIKFLTSFLFYFLRFFLLYLIYLRLMGCTLLEKSGDSCRVEITTRYLHDRLVFGVFISQTHFYFYRLYLIVVIEAFPELVIETETPPEKPLPVTLLSLAVFVNSYSKGVSSASTDTLNKDFSFRKPCYFGWIAVLLAVTKSKSSEITFAATIDLIVFCKYQGEPVSCADLHSLMPVQMPEFRHLYKGKSAVMLVKVIPQDP